MYKYESLLKHQHSAKERVIVVMGGKCQLCGYEKCAKALELHHIDPAQKDRVISGNLLNNSWDKLCNELQKCVLVCANCHREIHSGLYEGELKSSFNEGVAKMFSKMIVDLKSKHLHYCKTCGKVISSGAIRCADCSRLERSVPNKPNRDELKRLIRSTPFTAIAKEYGVTDNAVRKWCVSYKLPSKVSEIHKLSDEDWELI